MPIIINLTNPTPEEVDALRDIFSQIDQGDECIFADGLSKRQDDIEEAVRILLRGKDDKATDKKS